MFVVRTSLIPSTLLISGQKKTCDTSAAKEFVAYKDRVWTKAYLPLNYLGVSVEALGATNALLGEYFAAGKILAVTPTVENNVSSTLVRYEPGRL